MQTGIRSPEPLRACAAPAQDLLGWMLQAAEVSSEGKQSAFTLGTQPQQAELGGCMPRFPTCMQITSHAAITLPPVTPKTGAESRMCVLVSEERPGQCYFGVSITLAFAPLPLPPLFVFIFASERTKMPTCHRHCRATENVT